MSNSTRFKPISLRVLQVHIKPLAAVAASRGLNSSALIRLLIAREVRRAAKETALARQKRQQK